MVINLFFRLVKYPYTKTINLYLQTKIQHSLVLVILSNAFVASKINRNIELFNQNYTFNYYFIAVVVHVF